MKLISMTDFVLERVKDQISGSYDEKICELANCVIRIENYANFLKQPLTLGMFIPCDEKGNILKFDYPQNKAFDDIAQVEFQKQYQQAKERVLFEGFKIKNGLSICDENSALHTFWNYEGIWKLSEGMSTIEDVVRYNLTLTESAIKKLGL